MHQQRLGLTIPPTYEYGDWIRHAGAEQGCNRLALWLVHGGRIWLRSAGVAGKTHLVHALQKEHPGMGLVHVSGREQASSLQLAEQWAEAMAGKAFWAVDVDAGALPRSVGLALFHWLERARDLNRPLLIAWRCPADQLAPPELSSRLLAMEQVEVGPPPDDEALRQVLRSVTDSMQWELPESILDALLLYLPRQLDVLIPALRALDEQASVNRQRISRAWVAEQLERLGFLQPVGTAG